MAQSQLSVTERWRVAAPDRVVRMAMARETRWVVLADQGRTVTTLDEHGTTQWQVHTDFPIEDAGAAEKGGLFAVLLQDGALVAYGRAGILRWKIAFDRSVSCFDLGLTGQYVALGTRDQQCILYHPATGRQQKFKVDHPVASVALVETSDNDIVVAGRSGEISYLRADGSVVWSHRVRSHTGRVGVSGSGEYIIIPAYEEGIHTFLRTGEGAGAYDLGEHVILTDASRDGRVMAACTEENRMFVVDRDANVLWFNGYASNISHLALAARADFALLVMDGSQVVGLGLDAGGAAPAPSGPRKAAAAGGEDLIRVPGEEAAPEVIEASIVDEGASWEEPEEAAGAPEENEAVVELEPEVEEPASREGAERVLELVAEEEEEERKAHHPAGPVRPSEGRVLWKKALPGLDAGARIVSSRKGMAIAVLTSDGTLRALNNAGEETGQTRLSGASPELIEHRLEKFAAAWTREALVLLDTDTGKARRINLGALAPFAVGASGDLQLFVALHQESRAALITSHAKMLWRKRLPQPLRTVYLSPKGKRILIEDSENRFYFYDADGKLLRKVRLSATQAFGHVCVEESYTVFANRQGRVVVLDRKGRQIWSRRVCRELASIRPLGDHLAVTTEKGPCLVLDLYGDQTAWFGTRGGLRRLAKPRGRPPILFQAEDDVLTALVQPESKVAWRHHFGEPVTHLTADRDGRFVTCAAGRTIYYLDGSIGQGT